MNTNTTRIAGVALAASLLLAGFADGASARERIRHGTFSGANGGSAAWSHSVSRGVGYRSSSRSRTMTGQNGNTGSVNAEHGCTAGTGCSRSVERTGPNGKTYSHDSSTSRNEDGSISHSASTEGPNGGTGSRSSSFSKTDGGSVWTRSKEATAPNGNTASLDASGGCSGNSCSREVTRTGPNGNSVTRDRSTSWGDGSVTRETTTTGSNGGEVSRWVTVQ